MKRFNAISFETIDFLRYNNTAVKLPRSKTLDKSINPIAWTPFYTASPYQPLSDDRTITLRRHYYSAISWADYVAGQVFNEVSNLGLDDSTIILVHADHGWHLGEYAMWEKRTVWEFGTRVPFLIHVPWLTASHGERTKALVELIDVFPTLADLTGVGNPVDDTHGLEGVSFKQVIADPTVTSTVRGLLVRERHLLVVLSPSCSPPVSWLPFDVLRLSSKRPCVGRYRTHVFFSG